MKNTQKGFIVSLLIIIIVVLVIGAKMYIYTRNKTQGQLISNQPVSVNGKCGLVVSSIAPNAQVTFPLTVKGIIDNSNSKTLGCAWNMFEGQAGSVQLWYYFDNGGDQSLGINEWKELGASAPIKVVDWTSNKTTFTTTLNFNNDGIGLSNGTPLKITFTKENASGMPPVDTYDVPVFLYN